MKKSIFYLVTEDWYFRSHRLPLAKAMIKEGYDVYVISRFSRHNEEFENLGIKLIPFEFSRNGTNPFKETLSILKLIKIFRQYKPQMIHNIALQPVVYGSVAAFFSRTTVVINAIAGLGVVFTAPTFKNKCLRIILKRLMCFLLNRPLTTSIVQNKNDQAFLWDLGIKRSKIIFMPGAGVDLQKFYYLQSQGDKPVLTVISRMIWPKGIKVFIDAIKVLNRFGVKFEAWLVGIPDKHNSAAIPVAFLEQCETEGLIKWFRLRDDIENILAKTDIAVLPSYYGEGIPKVLLEAAAAGRPIVTTNIPGCVDAVTNGYNGLLVPPRDVAALAFALKKLIDNPELRQIMGQRSRQLAEAKYSHTIIVDKTLALYKQLNNQKVSR